MTKSRYRFREEAELKLIQEQMYYNEEKKHLVAGYPYLFPKESPKGTREVALKSMLRTERTLKKEQVLGRGPQDKD